MQHPLLPFCRIDDTLPLQVCFDMQDPFTAAAADPAVLFCTSGGLLGQLSTATGVSQSAACDAHATGACVTQDKPIVLASWCMLVSRLHDAVCDIQCLFTKCRPLEQ